MAGTLEVSPNRKASTVVSVVTVMLHPASVNANRILSSVSRASSVRRYSPTMIKASSSLMTTKNRHPVVLASPENQHYFLLDFQQPLSWCCTYPTPNRTKGSNCVILVKGTPKINMIPNPVNMAMRMVVTMPTPSKHRDSTRLLGLK
jgi:hypothetical protein